MKRKAFFCVVFAGCMLDCHFSETSSTNRSPRDRGAVKESIVKSTEFEAFLSAVAARDAEAIAMCFSEEALVVDVGRKISGRAAIRDWAQNEIVDEGLRYQVFAGHKTADGYSFTVAISSPKFSFKAKYELTVDGGLIARAVLDYA